MDTGYQTFTFVGRKEEIRTFNEHLTQYKLIGLFGLRAVGKSCFIHEVLKLKEEYHQILNLKTVQHVEDIYSIICASLHSQPFPLSSERSWIVHLIDLINNLSDCVLVFDNAENVIEGHHCDTFLYLCSELTQQCDYTKVVITSTTRVDFPSLHTSYFAHELKPLSHDDSKTLFNAVAPTVSLAMFENAILDLSEGLPLLIIVIAGALEQEKYLITAEDMVELLLESRLETLCTGSGTGSLQVDRVYKHFVLRLNEKLRQHLATLNYIPGSFTGDQAAQMLVSDYGSSARAKWEAIRPIRIRHMLNFNADRKRFDIQGIIREIVKAEIVIKDLPGVRRQYCEIYSAVMKEISNNMEGNDFVQALEEFSVEQPNLSKLLHEVHNTQEDTYHFFIEMAESCTELIEIYMAKDSQLFYDGCLKLAHRYNRDIDKASVNLAVGSMETQSKGEFQKGLEKYEAALSVLEKEGPSLKLATLYQKMGWNVYKQGKIVDSLTYYKKSLAISATRGKNYASVTLYTMSLTGAAYVVLGQYDIGEKYHNSCLKRIEQLHGRINPKVGVELNRIGVLHDQRGDTLTALEYFLRGLDVKRRSNAAHYSVAFSLSNIANSYNTLKRWDEAHDKVDEAFEILEKHPVPHMDALSLMYNTRGKTYSKQERWPDAEVAFRKCVEITRKVDDKSYIFMKRLVNLAEVQEKRNRLQACLQTANQAHALSASIIKAVPHVFIIMECLQCMCRVYKMLGKQDQFIESLKEMEMECFRLKNVYTELENQIKQEQIVKFIEDVKKMWMEVRNEKLQ